MTNPRRPARSRRAGVYIMVLVTAMIVTVIGMSAVRVAMVQRRTAGGNTDLGSARLIASSGIELALLELEAAIQNERDTGTPWISLIAEGAWSADISIGDGIASWRIVDSADAIAWGDPTNTVQIQAAGRVHEAAHTLALDVAPGAGGTGVDALLNAITCVGSASLNSTTLDADAPVTANTDISASGSTINADVEASGMITGGAYNGAWLEGAPPRTVPAAAAMTFYVTNGTPIDIATIPSSFGTRYIDEVLISPTSNPYSLETNALGIYVIDCQGQELTIRDCRIIGTLVLLNPGSISGVEGQVNWEPALPNYPALLVDGPFALRFKRNDLSEQAESTNFNPSESPYQGSANNDQLDSYPSAIKGIIATTGDLWLNGTTGPLVQVLGSIIVGGNLNTWAFPDFEVIYSPEHYNNPPPGFFGPGGALAPIPGTFVQVNTPAGK